jgi:hypothetical protein
VIHHFLVANQGGTKLRVESLLATRTGIPGNLFAWCLLNWILRETRLRKIYG